MLFWITLLAVYALILVEDTNAVALGSSESLIESKSLDGRSFSLVGMEAKPPRLLRGRPNFLKGNGKENELADPAVSSLFDDEVESMQAAQPTKPKKPSKSPPASGAQVPVPTGVPALMPSLSSSPSLVFEPTDFPTLPPSASALPSSIFSMTPSDTLSSSTPLESANSTTMVPSLSPSGASSLLTVSSEPSDIPSSPPVAAATEEKCNLEATVDCRLEDGEPCTSLSITPQKNSTCEDRPYELEWLYTARSCDESTATQAFKCKEENGGPSSVFMAYMTITGLPSKHGYVSRIIFPGTGGFPVQSVVVKNEPNKTLDKELRVTIRKESLSGELLQEVTLPTTCDKKTAWNIGDSFGALQLASFRNDEISSTHTYAKLTWIFSARNAGSTTSVLKSMATGINDISTTVSPDVSLHPGEEYLIVAHETISLAKADTFQGVATMLEDGVLNECWATSNYTFDI